MDKISVKLNDETLCTGTWYTGTVPYMLWFGVIVDENTDRDALVERLQASNARWEGFLTKENTYVLLLPPIFKVEAV